MLFFSIIAAAFVESIVSFSGVFLVMIAESFVKTFAHRLLGFAIGALLGVAFFDIIPEAIGSLAVDIVFRYVIIGIIIFFTLEKFFRWYHSQAEDWKIQPYAYLIFLGGVIHNFIDGVALALSFFVSPALGVATASAILFHEIPHGIADFSALVRGGYTRARAAMYSFIVSITTVLGALVTYVFGSFLLPVLPYLLAIIAGNFLYLALSDLVPETHEESNISHFASQVVLMAAGVAIMHVIGKYFGG